MEREDFIKQSEELSRDASELIDRILVRQNTATLEFFYAELKKRDKKIERLEKTLGTCISWHQNEFGVAAVEQLLEMLNKE